MTADPPIGMAVEAADPEAILATCREALAKLGPPPPDLVVVGDPTRPGTDARLVFDRARLYAPLYVAPVLFANPPPAEGLATMRRMMDRHMALVVLPRLQPYLEGGTAEEYRQRVRAHRRALCARNRRLRQQAKRPRRVRTRGHGGRRR